MSSVFLIRRGAGGSVSGAYAVISVTYPVGSLCSVRREGAVYRDLRRDGIAFFAVPAPGDWTVAITDGEKNQSKTVTITERGEIVRLLLRYAGDSLYEPGSGLESLWQTTGAASAGSESIVVQASARTTQSFAYLKEPVSLAGASSLTVSAAQTIVTLGGEPGPEPKPTTVYVIPEGTAATDTAHAVKTLQIGEGDFTGENACVIDVSDLASDRRYYVTIRSRVSQWDGSSVRQAVGCTFTVTGITMT